MVVDDLNFVSVAPAKLETNTPSCVYTHRPLISALAFQLVQADAFERTKIVQRLGDVKRQEQIDGRFEVEATKLVWPLSVPHLRATELRHDRIMAQMYYARQ